MKKLITAFVLLLLVTAIASAQDVDSEATSANYSLLGSVTSGGGTSSSANYSLTGSVGEFEGGEASSASYAMQTGYRPQVYYATLRIFDINDDGVIGPEDAIFVINRNGQLKTTLNGIADVNRDGNIDQADIDEIIANFGTTP